MVMYLFASAWKAHVELSVGKKKKKKKKLMLELVLNL